MEAIRSLSAVTIAVGGWRRSPALIVAGAALIGLGWSHGLLPAHRHSDTPLPHFGPHHWGGEGRQPTRALASWAKAEKRSLLRS
jgi:hypothetical protein